MNNSLHKVKIINDGENIQPSHVYIDGKELHYVTDVDYFHLAVGEVPTFRFTTVGIPELCEINKANVEFEFTPSTTSEALSILMARMNADEEFRKMFPDGTARCIIKALEKCRDE